MYCYIHQNETEHEKIYLYQEKKAAKDLKKKQFKKIIDLIFKN